MGAGLDSPLHTPSTGKVPFPRAGIQVKPQLRTKSRRAQQPLASSSTFPYRFCHFTIYTIDAEQERFARMPLSPPLWGPLSPPLWGPLPPPHPCTPAPSSCPHQHPGAGPGGSDHQRLHTLSSPNGFPSCRKHAPKPASNLHLSSSTREI